jgi:tetratricopeptide (TPR) repeat protein
MSSHPYKIGVLLIAALIYPVGAIAQSAPPNAEFIRLLQLGSEAMHRGNAAEAEKYFSQAAVASPESADAYLGLGLAELRQGKLDDADKSLTKTLDLNPRMQGAHMFLGITNYQMNKLPAAIAALNEEVQLHPKNAEALTWLGIVDLEAGQPDEAAAALDQASALEPTDANVLYYRARAHSLIAEEAYQALYKLDPDSWLVHRALGETYSASRQPEKAITEFQAAIDKQPTNSQLYEALGNEDQRVAKFDDAKKAYEKEVQLSPHNAIALYNLGKIQIERGDPETGVSLMRQALGAHASYAPTCFYLGLGLSKLGKNQEASEYLEKALANNPSHFIQQSGYYELARVYQKLGRKDDADRALDALKKLKAAAAPANNTTAPANNTTAPASN